jgi:hypothetical protein
MIIFEAFLGMFNLSSARDLFPQKPVSKLKPNPYRFILSILFVASCKIHVVLKNFLKTMDMRGTSGIREVISSDFVSKIV